MLGRCLRPCVLVCRRCERLYSAAQGGVNVFDRYTKRLQKNRAAMAPDVATYDYIRDEVVHCADLLSMRCIMCGGASMAEAGSTVSIFCGRESKIMNGWCPAREGLAL